MPEENDQPRAGESPWDLGVPIEPVREGWAEDLSELDSSLSKTAPPELREDVPVRWREILAVVLLVVLCDVTLYRGQGLAGYALLFAVAPVLLVLGRPRPRFGAGVWIIGGMLLLLAARMAWLGSALNVAAGFTLLVALALALAGQTPYVLDVLVCALQTPVAGYLGLRQYGRSAGRVSPRGLWGFWLNMALPLATLLIFGGLFVLANPDLLTSFVETARWIFRSLFDWINGVLPSGWEIVFWVAVAWLSVGLLRPILRRSVLARFSKPSSVAGDALGQPAEAPLYAALRNTLVAVIGLFAVYLVFEFKTLWFREFPKGFYYAGYAHEGAAWLTVALALATVILSLIFRGRVLRDPRLPRLRRLAWIWSLENFVLAIAVYHRLFIYIDFNGMTRMRTVGFFGMTAVAIGFFLVVGKIAYQRDFVWLLRRQLWTLAVIVYLFSLTPVDALVHTYNVRRVLAGDLAPSVQISVHPINAEGILVLHPLVESDDEIIREGVRALLAERALEAERVARQRQRLGWTAFQLADHLLLERLQAVRPDWKAYVDAEKRYAALERFHEYVYQWY